MSNCFSCCYFRKLFLKLSKLNCSPRNSACWTLRGDFNKIIWVEFKSIVEFKSMWPFTLLVCSPRNSACWTLRGDLNKIIWVEIKSIVEFKSFWPFTPLVMILLHINIIDGFCWPAVAKLAKPLLLLNCSHELSKISTQVLVNCKSPRFWFFLEINVYLLANLFAYWLHFVL